jgi:hypothetical protein
MAVVVPREALEFLRLRKRAYQLTFGNNRIVTSLRRAYAVAFGNYAGQEVLTDLSKFCRAVQPEWSDDARHHARLSGRREVFLRITEHMHLSSEQLYALYNGKSIKPPVDDDQDS